MITQKAAVSPNTRSGDAAGGMILTITKLKHAKIMLEVGVHTMILCDRGRIMNTTTGYSAELERTGTFKHPGILSSVNQFIADTIRADLKGRHTESLRILGPISVTNPTSLDI